MDNSISFLTSPNDLRLLLALVERSDDVRLKSESTRILINLIRSLFATKATTNLPDTSIIDEEVVEEKKAVRKVLITEQVVRSLSELMRTNEKFPLLVNEAIVGLTLLASSDIVAGTSCLAPNDQSR